MRILFILRTPWRRELGASRVCLELAEALEAAGHEIAHLTIDDVWPVRRVLPEGRLKQLAERIHGPFPECVRRWLRKTRGEFDIIDAMHGDLPFNRQELGLEGALLVARSVGLFWHYRERNRVGSSPHGRPRMRDRWLRTRATEESAVIAQLRNADLINVPNEDERMTLADRFGLGEKTVVIPFGMTAERFAVFGEAATTPEKRLGGRRVVFVGSWDDRKGRHVIPALLRSWKQRDRGVRLRLLGTGFPAAVVLSDFAEDLRGDVEVIPSFGSGELPELLADCAVGLFPSSMEGFGFAVLEMLASGIPVHAFDVPGPREMLRRVSYDALHSIDDPDQIGRAVMAVLDLSAPEYEQLGRQSREVAAGFRWRQIAEDTISCYESALSDQH